MPIFEYKCSECNTVYEIFHKSSSDVEEVFCPECKSEKHIKLISSFASINSKSSDFSGGCESGNCGFSPSSGGCSSGMCGLD